MSNLNKSLSYVSTIFFKNDGFIKRKPQPIVCPDWDKRQIEELADYVIKLNAVWESKTFYPDWTKPHKHKIIKFSGCTPEARKILREKPFKKMTAGDIFLSQLNHKPTKKGKK
jgi:hypothetical protein